MKSWAWALGASVALHLAAVGTFLRPSKTQPMTGLPEAPARRAIAVSLWQAGEARKPAVSKPVRRARKVTSSKPIAPTGSMASAVQEAAAASEGFGGAFSVAPSENTIDLSQLYQRLSESARGCYPPRARRFRLEGLAQVSFCLSENGQLKTATLEKSSGHTPLDMAATDCVVPNAMPFHAPSGCYSVPVRFAAVE